MTVEYCVNYCSGLDYIYAGLEYASQCCKRAFSNAVLLIPVVLLTPCLHLSLWGYHHQRISERDAFGMQHAMYREFE